MSEPLNPTLVEIARAITAAARLHDESPLDVASGVMGSRARWLAFAALIDAFPDVYFRNIAEWCGWRGCEAGNARAALAFNIRHQKWRWWRKSDLKIVKDELAAAIAESEREIEAQAEALKMAVWRGLATDAEIAEELRDRGAEDGVAPPSSAVSTALPGMGGDIDRAPVQEVMAAEPVDAERVARVERMQKWQAGAPMEPPTIMEGGAARPVHKMTKIEMRLARAGLLPAVEISEASNEAEKSNEALAHDVPQPDPKIEPVCQPPAATPKPPAVSPAARALASFQRSTRAPVKAAQESAPRRGFDSTAFSAGHYKPDRPAHQRGVEVVTASFFGDPAPGRSALDQRLAERKE